MFSVFLDICKSINIAFSIKPLLYGSLGLEQRLKQEMFPDDIDVLLPDKYINGCKWVGLKKHMEALGYELTDLHEHTFQEDGVRISYAVLEELGSFADINISLIPEENLNGASYYLLTLEDYLKVYNASSKDGYRIKHKNKQDNEKIKLIKQNIYRATEK